MDAEKVKEDLATPRSPEEALEIRKYLRERIQKDDELNHQRRTEALKLYSQQQYDQKKTAMVASIDYGKAFVRIAVLLNGGAIVALLAFVSSALGRSDGKTLLVVINFSQTASISFYVYCAGLVCGALTAAAGYYNFQIVNETYFHSGHTLNMMTANDIFGGSDREKELANFDRADRWVAITAWAGTGFGFLSFRSPASMTGRSQNCCSRRSPRSAIPSKTSGTAPRAS